MCLAPETQVHYGLLIACGCTLLADTGMVNLSQTASALTSDQQCLCHAGCFAWLYGLDVLTMDDIADRILLGHEDDDLMRAIAQG